MNQTQAHIIVFCLLLSFLLPLVGNAATITEFKDDASDNLPDDGEYNAIAVGKVNADEHLDIAFGGDDYSGDTVGLYSYFGNGEGAWTLANSGLPSEDSWGGTAFGDADGDGQIELYACNEGWGSDSGPIKGVGAWEYTGSEWSQTGISSPYTSDTTNDLKVLNFTKGPGLDIAFTFSRDGAKGVRVYSGSGSDPISWTDNSVGLPTSGEYAGIDVMDFNDDGLPDIATVGYGARHLHIYTQNDEGNGWTDRSSTLPDDARTGGTMIGVVMGDLNNDDATDIIYAHRDKGMRLILGNDGGSPGGTAFEWTEANDGLPSSATSGRYSQIQLADIDKDGDLDILGAKANSGLRLFLGDGNQEPGDDVTFTEVTEKGLPTSGAHYGAAYLDFDADGDLDVAGATWGDGVSVYRTVLGEAADLKPVADAGEAQELLTGEEVELDGSGSSDPEDGDVSEFKWTVDAGNPEEVSLSDDTAEDPKFTAPNTPGDYLFSLVVKDSGGQESDPDQVQITVKNRPPVADAGEDLEAYTDDLVTLNGTGSSDPEDGEVSSYRWTVDAGNPEELSLSDDQAAEPGFTSPATHGDYHFSLEVQDSQGEWSEEDQVIVSVLNRLPVADAGQNFSSTVDNEVTLNGSKSGDPDGSVEHYEWTCTSHSVILDDPDSPAPSFTPAAEGEYDFSLKVQDNDGEWSEDADEVTVTVVAQGENLIPTSDAGVDQTVILGETVYLDGTGSDDPDGDIVEWEWSCTGHLFNCENIDTATPYFTPEETGDHLIRLRVRDNNDTWSSEDRVIIKVLPEPEPPVAKVGVDQEVVTGESVTLDGSESVDPDGYIAEYIWNCSSHDPAPALDFSAGDAKPAFVAEEEGLYVFTLAVKDNDGLWSLEDTVNITVEKAKENSAPVVVITLPLDGQNRSGQVLINWIATDPDGDNMLSTLMISQDSGSSWTVLCEDLPALGEESFAWETNNSQFPNGDNYRIKVVTTDDNSTGVKESVVETGDFSIYNQEEDPGSDDEDDDEDDEDSPGFGFSFLVLALVLSFLLVQRRRG